MPEAGGPEPLLSVVVPVYNEEKGLPELQQASSRPPSRMSRADTRSCSSTTARRIGLAELIEEWAAVDERRRPRAALAQLRDGDRDVRRARLRPRPVTGDHARGPPGSARADPGDARARGERERRRRLRPAHRPRREPAQAHARRCSTRYEPARPRALPGPGGRLPADVAPRDRDDPGDGRAPPLPARAWSTGSASSRSRSSTGEPGGRAAGRLVPGPLPPGVRGDRVVLRRPAQARDVLRHADRTS